MSLRRFYGLCAVLVLLAGIVLCRTYWVGQQTAYAANAGGQRYYALCMPGEAGYTALFPYVSYEAQGLLYERRNLSTPFLVQTDRDLTGQGIPTCTVPEHFTGTTAAHLLGYLDGEGHGVAGLERAYDDLLAACGDKRSITCIMTIFRIYIGYIINIDQGNA